MGSLENVMNPRAVANASAEERVAFIRRTYAHLAGAIGLFVLLEMLLLKSPVAGWMLQVAGAPFGWLAVLGGFVVVSWFARSFAYGMKSVGMQYLGLGLFVLAEAVIFLPLMFFAVFYSSPTVLPTAGILPQPLPPPPFCSPLIRKKASRKRRRARCRRTLRER